MSQLMKPSRTQLQLSLDPVMVLPQPVEQVRAEVIEVLADLLLEAMGLEENCNVEEEKEVSDEREDYA